MKSVVNKSISVLLAFFLLIVSSFPVSAADTYEYELDNKGIITYEIDNGEIIITGYNNESATSGSVVIPSEIDGVKVTEIGRRVFRDCNDKDQIISVTLPDTIKRIGVGCFYMCSNLKSLNIPDNVEEIGEGAFMSCTSLEELIFPSKLKRIEDNVCNGCSTLKSVTFPEGIKEIGVSAFESCIELKEITLPSTVTLVDGCAFYKCSSVRKVTINSDSLTRGQDAFRLEAPEGTVSLSIPVTIGNYLNFFSYYGRNCCNEIHITKGSSGECADGEDVSRFNNEYIKKIVVEEGVLSLSDYMFQGATALTELILPSTLKKIGEQTFQNCSSLQELKLPEKLEHIGKSAFYGCSSLTEVTIPESVEYIGNQAFFNNSALSQVILPTECDYIGEQAFPKNDNLLMTNSLPDDYYYYNHASKGLKELLDDTTLYVNQETPQRWSYPISNSAMVDKTIVIGDKENTQNDWGNVFDDMNSSSFDGNTLRTFIYFNKDKPDRYLFQSGAYVIYKFDTEYQDYYSNLVDSYVDYYGYTREEVIKLLNGYAADADIDMLKEFGDDVATINDATVSLPASRYNNYFEKWLKEIHLNANGGIYDDGGTEQYIIYLNNEEFSTPKQPTRYGYNCLGYTFAPDRTDIIEETFEVKHNYHLYANWELKDSSVIVNYVDEEGTPLIEPVTIEGKVFDDYETAEKSFTGYDLTGTPDNKVGTMTEDVITVNYIYRLKDASVNVKYIEDGTDNELADTVTIDGKYGKPYTTEEKSFYGYQLIETPEGATGNYELAPITVTYRYQKKDATVTVKYLCDGEEISGTDTISGKVFDEYKTFKKDIEGYTLNNTPENSEGVMTEEEILVIYEYSKVIEPVPEEVPGEEPKESEIEESSEESAPSEEKEQTKPKQNKTMISPKTGAAFSFLTVAYFSIGLGITILFIIRKKRRLIV